MRLESLQTMIETINDLKTLFESIKHEHKEQALSMKRQVEQIQELYMKVNHVLCNQSLVEDYKFIILSTMIKSFYVEIIDYLSMKHGWSASKARKMSHKQLLENCEEFNSKQVYLIHQCTRLIDSKVGILPICKTNQKHAICEHKMNDIIHSCAREFDDKEREIILKASMLIIKKMKQWTRQEFCLNFYVINKQ